MLTVLVDMDGICADFLGLLLERYNAATGEGITKTGIKEFHMKNSVQNPELLYKLFHEPGFFTDLPPIPGAQANLEAMCAAGHNVYIVSAQCTSHSAQEKLEWVDKHLPFIGSDRTVITKQKHLIQGDVLIDDSISNAMEFRKANASALIMTIPYTYNEFAPTNKILFDPYSVRLDGKSDEEAWMAMRRIVAVESTGFND